METILIFAVVMAPIFVVMVPWATVVAMGFSKSKSRMVTRPQRIKVTSRIDQMRNSRAWSRPLEALFYSLGGLVAVPGVAGTYYFLTTGEVLGLMGIIFGVVTFGLWFYTAGRLGLWVIWRDVFSQCITMTGRVSEHWIETSKVIGETGEVESRQHGITVNEQPFHVSQKIYEWLLEGDEVCVSYWPHTKKVSRVDRVTAK